MLRWSLKMSQRRMIWAADNFSSRADCYGKRKRSSWSWWRHSRKWPARCMFFDYKILIINKLRPRVKTRAEFLDRLRGRKFIVCRRKLRLNGIEQRSRLISRSIHRRPSPRRRLKIAIGTVSGYPKNKRRRGKRCWKAPESKKNLSARFYQLQSARLEKKKLNTSENGL